MRGTTSGIDFGEFHFDAGVDEAWVNGFSLQLDPSSAGWNIDFFTDSDNLSVGNEKLTGFDDPAWFEDDPSAREDELIDRVFLDSDFWLDVGFLTKRHHFGKSEERE